jgi:hypothetical protein
MIKRILDPEDFKILADDIFNYFNLENEESGHYFLIHDKQSIINNFANKYILAWDVFVWANFNGKNYDSVVIFINDKSVKFNQPIFLEFIWLSKNPKVGYKLFKEAVSFARARKFKYICMSRVYKHPKSEKVKNFYEKMGLIKDTQTFIGKL